ncbi:MAG: hypothetical protein IT384_06785 [Deltaproteobacteria bacterium]|nr:hypothetical protein [Deltaproteobacteria bacterium]
MDSEVSVRILQEIRDEIKSLRHDGQAFVAEQRQFNGEQRAFNQQAVLRFQALETTLRDLAEQMVMLGRGLKVLIEQRPRTEDRIDDLELRVSALERKG